MALSYDERACSRRAGGSSSRCSPSRRASPPRCRRSASSFPCSRTRSAGAAAQCPSRCRSASSWEAWPRSSGRVADRRGPRGVLAATVALGAVGFALSARIDALWHFYLSYGLLVGVGMSSIYVLSAATVARWFETRRGMALAIVLSGFNLGWLTAGPLAAWLIGRFGWRAAYVALGALIAAVGVPASLCVSYPPSAEARPVTAGSRPRRA